jgi:hypothetical protein
LVLLWRLSWQLSLLEWDRNLMPWLVCLKRSFY